MISQGLISDFDQFALMEFYEMEATSLSVSCSPSVSPTTNPPHIVGLVGHHGHHNAFIIVMLMFSSLSLRHVVDAVGNPETIVRFILLELLSKFCHLVPDDDVDNDGDDI